MSKNLDNRSTPAPKKRAPRTVCNPEDIRYAMPAETSAKIEKISEAFDAAFRELPDSPTNKARNYSHLLVTSRIPQKSPR